MYYTIEYTDPDLISPTLWTIPGIFLNVDHLVTVVENQKDLIFLKTNDSWLVQPQAQHSIWYKLKIIESSSCKEILEFKYSNGVICHYKPVYESFLVETNEVISIHADHSYLKNNMNILMPDKKWEMRAFKPINPWQLNIKDALCTML